MGPIQIFLLGLEDFAAIGGIAEELAALSDRGTIRIVDARFLLKGADSEVVAVRASDLDDSEREDLRCAAGALVGLGAGAVLGGDEGAAAGLVLGASAAMDVGELGMNAAEISQLGEELEAGDALLLLVIENVWAAGLPGAFRDAGVVFGQQDYLAPEGLMALGAMLGLQVALDARGSVADDRELVVGGKANRPPPTANLCEEQWVRRLQADLGDYAEFAGAVDRLVA
jgi:hypothetical protein